MHELTAELEAARDADRLHRRRIAVQDAEADRAVVAEERLKQCHPEPLSPAISAGRRGCGLAIRLKWLCAKRSGTRLPYMLPLQRLECV